MRGVLAGLFAKSPFGPLGEHMAVVKKCVDLLKPLFEALIEKDYEKEKNPFGEIVVSHCRGNLL